MAFKPFGSGLSGVRSAISKAKPLSTSMPGGMRLPTSAPKEDLTNYNVGRQEAIDRYNVQNMELKKKQDAEKQALDDEKTHADIISKVMGNTENENVMRAEYGGRSPEELNSELKSSTTGYSSPTPGLAKFLKRPMTLDMIKQRSLQQERDAGKTNTKDQASAAAAFIDSFNPGDEDANGNPVTVGAIQREASLKFRGVNFNHPAIQKSLARFKAPAKVDSGQGFMDKVANFFDSGKNDPLEFATEDEAHAAGLPNGTPIIVGGRPATYRQ